MPAELEYTPIRPRAGGRVHAFTLTDPGRTACGRKCRGWVVIPSAVDCQKCKEIVYFDVRNAVEPRGVREGT